MSIKKGNTDISKIYVGSNEVDKIYKGNTLIYEKQQPQPSSYNVNIDFSGWIGTGTYIYAPNKLEYSTDNGTNWTDITPTGSGNVSHRIITLNNISQIMFRFIGYDAIGVCSLRISSLSYEGYGDYANATTTPNFVLTNNLNDVVFWGVDNTD